MLLILVVTPLVVWFLAFLIWFFWHEITRNLAPGKTATRPGISAPRDEEPAKDRQPQPIPPPRENIAEEDRKKLDDILQRR